MSYLLQHVLPTGTRHDYGVQGRVHVQGGRREPNPTPNLRPNLTLTLILTLTCSRWLTAARGTAPRSNLALALALALDLALTLTLTLTLALALALALTLTLK